MRTAPHTRHAGRARRAATPQAFMAALHKNTPLSAPRRADNTRVLYAALAAMLAGKAVAEHVDVLADAANLCLVLAERNDWQAQVPTLIAARDALARVIRRGLDTRRWLLDGDARAALTSMIDVFEAAMEVLPPRDFRLAEQEVKRRIAAGERVEVLA